MAGMAKPIVNTGMNTSERNIVSLLHLIRRERVCPLFRGTNVSLSRRRPLRDMPKVR
jgi:hypothetical protein